MILLAVMLQAAATSPAPPLPPLHGGPAPMICPVGGEPFSAFRPGSWSTFGERPDGKPYSYLPLPFPLPECPTNRLVVFDEFTPAELARLPALIASSDYRALVRTDTPYYRASWLATRLGRPATQALWLLLAATWEVKGGDMAAPARPDLARRYDEAVARGAAALPGTADAKDRKALLARGANAWRELGRFDAARQLLDRSRAVTVAGRDGDGGWTAYLESLTRVIARRDASVEPLDLIPPRRAAERCASGHPPLSDQERTLCTLPAIGAAR